MTEQEATRLLAMLYETHQRPITGFLLTIVQDEQQAADLCQDTFLKAWDYLNRQDANVPRTESHMKNWLYEIARNLAYDHLRKHSKLQFYSLLDGSELLIDGHEERLIERIQLYKMLAELPQQQQESVVRRYILGDSEKEVAADLNTKPKTISSNASRGKESLNKKIYQVNIDIRVMETKTLIRRRGYDIIPLFEKRYGPKDRIDGSCWNFATDKLLALDDEAFRRETREMTTIDWSWIDHYHRYMRRLEYLYDLYGPSDELYKHLYKN